MKRRPGQQMPVQVIVIALIAVGGLVVIGLGL